MKSVTTRKHENNSPAQRWERASDLDKARGRAFSMYLGIQSYTHTHLLARAAMVACCGSLSVSSLRAAPSLTVWNRNTPLQSRKREGGIGEEGGGGKGGRRWQGREEVAREGGRWLLKFENHILH